MMIRYSVWSAVLAMVVCGPVRAGELAADPAFDRYFDRALLTQGLEEGDASLVADAALQLAEGERVLLRTHRSLNARDVARVALKLAAAKADAKTVARLKAFADRAEDAAFKTEVAAVEKLASAARSVDPSLVVSVETTPAEHVEILRSLTDEVTTAALLGNKDCLLGIEESLPYINSLTDAQRGFLKSSVSSALKDLAKPTATTDALRDLLHAQRGIGNFNGIPVPTPNFPRKPEDVIPRKPQDLFPNTTSPTPGFAGNSPKKKPVEIQYTILNRSKQDVSFQLFPSGKSYTLRANAKEPASYTSYQIDGRNPWIKITATGETFAIPGGNFQFYSDGGRIRWSYR
jgi:hypothetical protein